MTPKPSNPVKPTALNPNTLGIPPSSPKDDDITSTLSSYFLEDDEIQQMTRVEAYIRQTAAILFSLLPPAAQDNIRHKASVIFLTTKELQGDADEYIEAGLPVTPEFMHVSWLHLRYLIRKMRKEFERMVERSVERELEREFETCRKAPEYVAVIEHYWPEGMRDLWMTVSELERKEEEVRLMGMRPWGEVRGWSGIEGIV